MISLYVMGSKGLAVLESLFPEYSKEIAYIVSSDDPDTYDTSYLKIKKISKKYKILFYDRKDTIEKNNRVTHIIAISWRWMIHENQRCLIILHDSLLPRYRGFNPLVTALLNRDKKIGVTAFFGNVYFDQGDIIQQESVNIKYPIKINEAISLIEKCYIKIIQNILKQLKQGKKLKCSPQNEELASYSLWRDEYDYEIDWTKDANTIKLFIDSVGMPYKGASTWIENKKIRIMDAEVVQDVTIENRHEGKCIFIDKGYPIIVCRKGLLKLLDVRTDDGKRRLIPFKKYRIRLGEKKFGHTI